MSHGKIFPSASERTLGLECLGLSGKQSKQLHWGKGICLFFLERSFPSWWLCLPPPTWGGEVTLTSNKDHSECICAVGVISALER